jgi:hypothetical protein
LAVIIILAAIFDIWGYVKAQAVKEDGEKLRQLTADLIVLEEVDPYSSQIPLEDWKNLAENSSVVLREIEEFSAIGDSLKQKISEFFLAKPADKYREAQYLQLLISGQEILNLKNEQPRTRAEIIEIISTLKATQKEINDKDLSLGPDLNQSLGVLEVEADIFLNECERVVDRMTDSGPPTPLRMANFDKATDELKIAIAQSLNDYVQLQDELKLEINLIADSSWINPLW